MERQTTLDRSIEGSNPSSRTNEEDINKLVEIGKLAVQEEIAFNNWIKVVKDVSDERFKLEKIYYGCLDKLNDAVKNYITELSTNQMRSLQDGI